MSLGMRHFYVQNVEQLLVGVVIPIRSETGRLIGEARLQMDYSSEIPHLLAVGILNRTADAKKINELLENGMVRTIEMTPKTLTCSPEDHVYLRRREL